MTHLPKPLNTRATKGSSTPGCLLFSAAQGCYSAREKSGQRLVFLFCFVLFLNGFPNVKHKVNYVIRNTQAHRKLTQLWPREPSKVGLVFVFQSNEREDHGAWSPESSWCFALSLKGQNIKSHHNQAGYMPVGIGTHGLTRCKYKPSRMIERTGREV